MCKSVIIHHNNELGGEGELYAVCNADDIEFWWAAYEDYEHAVMYCQTKEFEIVDSICSIADCVGCKSEVEFE